MIPITSNSTHIANNGSDSTSIASKDPPIASDGISVDACLERLCFFAGLHAEIMHRIASSSASPADLSALGRCLLDMDPSAVESDVGGQERMRAASMAFLKYVVNLLPCCRCIRRSMSN